MPTIITVLVIGGLVATVLGWAARPSAASEGRIPVMEDAESKARRDLVGVGAALLLSLWLYPPLLHLTTALTFGLDLPVVSRYSMSFSPLLVVLVLKLLPRRAFAWALALSGIAMLGAMAYTLPLQT